MEICIKINVDSQAVERNNRKISLLSSPGGVTFQSYLQYHTQHNGLHAICPPYSDSSRFICIHLGVGLVEIILSSVSVTSQDADKSHQCKDPMRDAV